MGLSVWQILIIVLVVVLLFGAGKIPRLMGDVAKGIKSFKSGLREDEQEGEGEATPRQIEGEPANRSTTGASTGAAPGAASGATPRNDETART